MRKVELSAVTKLTRNPNLTFFLGGGGGGGEEEGECNFYSSRRTPVQNYFEIHAYM